MKHSMRSWMRVILGLLLAALFAWLVLRHMDWTQARQALAQMKLWPLALALGALTLDYTLRILRWWRMLDVLESNISPIACVRPFLGSFAVNNVLPFRIGDAVRVLGFSRQLRSPKMRLLGTLFIERIFDLLTLLGFFFIGLLFVPAGAMPPQFIHAAEILAAVAILLVALLILLPNQVIRLATALGHKSFIQARKPLRFGCEKFIQLVQTLIPFRSAAWLSQMVVLSVTIWLLEAAVFLCVGWALGLAIPVHSYLFIAASGTLATLIPSSPGYVGTFDFFTLKAAAAFDIPDHQAALLALMTHIALWLPITIVGGLMLLIPLAFGHRSQPLGGNPS